MRSRIRPIFRLRNMYLKAQLLSVRSKEREFLQDPYFRLEEQIYF